MTSCSAILIGSKEKEVSWRKSAEARRMHVGIGHETFACCTEFSCNCKVEEIKVAEHSYSAIA